MNTKLPYTALNWLRSFADELININHESTSDNIYNLKKVLPKFNLHKECLNDNIISKNRFLFVLNDCYGINFYSHYHFYVDYRNRLLCLFYGENEYTFLKLKQFRTLG
jgi:hypothetical protein